MNEILVINAGLVPVITALVEAVKAAGLPSRFAPIASIFTGVVFSALSSWATLPVYDAKAAVLGAVIGVVTGLAASGLYSGVKANVNDTGTVAQASTSRRKA
jgi:hypothetical protein